MLLDASEVVFEFEEEEYDDEATEWVNNKEDDDMNKDDEDIEVSDIEFSSKPSSFFLLLLSCNLCFFALILLL